jgi:hypothetical protein
MSPFLDYFLLGPQGICHPDEERYCSLSFIPPYYCSIPFFSKILIDGEKLD